MLKQEAEDFALCGGEQAFASFRTTMNLVVPDRGIFFKYAKQSFAARHLTNHGPAVKELERQLAEFHSVKHCVAFCNCFTAMYIALHCLALPGKKEVVVPSLTYRRMADIIDWAGLLPRFCDVDPDTLGISSETARPCINENTALILAPHPITRLCDIEGMEAIAKEYGLPLVFDSVEACGGAHKGTMIGGFGDCESFSMHPSKVLNSCEGGYITTNNDDIAQTLKIARAFGFFGRDNIIMLGHNAKLNELHAAMGLSTLAGLDRQFADNKRIHLAYQFHLSNLPGVSVIPYDHTEKRNWKSVLVRLDEADEAWPLSREETLKLLNAENVHARAYYAPPQHVTFPRQAGKGGISLPVTDNAVTNHLILPFGSTVSEEDTAVVGRLFQAMLDFHRPLRSRMAQEKP